MESKIPRLRNELLRLARLGSLKYRAEWDMEVNLPAGHLGHSAVAEDIAEAAELIHNRFISHQFEDALAEARVSLSLGILSLDEACIVRETLSDFEKEKKLPTRLVAELAKVTAEAHDVWVNARKNSDFQSFAPHLKTIIDLKIEETECLGYTNSPYDALMDEHAPGFTSSDAERMFNSLKLFLIPFIQKINESNVKINTDFLKRHVPIEKQREIIKDILAKIGYNFKAGRLGVSAHPFSTSFHPTDCPITVTYDQHDFIRKALFAGLHEAGHAMYEQGLPAEFFGTPRGESLEHDIHESQSLLWENVVGHSLPFWKHFFWSVENLISDGDITPFQFYRVINKAKPSTIRLETDEVAYNLHIIIRFEIEKALIEGTLRVNDASEAWNTKTKEYLGLDVPNDAAGILQDVHWSGGLFGYFPAYTRGSLGSVQIYEAAKIAIPDLETEIAGGNFSVLNSWLRDNIYNHGRLYSSSELIQRATGEILNPRYFISYLTDKYSEIYKL